MFWLNEPFSLPSTGAVSDSSIGKLVVVDQAGTDRREKRFEIEQYVHVSQTQHYIFSTVLYSFYIVLSIFCYFVIIVLA